MPGGHDAAAVSLHVEPFPGPDVLRAWWGDLERRADTTFFLTWGWIGALLAESGIEPAVVTGRAGNEIVALGLLQAAVRQRHRGLLRSRTLFLNETGDAAKDGVYIEHNGFLVDRRFGADLEARLVSFVARDDAGLPAWDELRLGGTPARYLDLARRAGLELQVGSEAGTAAVDLQAIRASGKDYADHLSANARYQLRRSLRQYRTLGALQCEAAGDVAEAQGWLDELAALHQAYWTGRGKPGAFAQPFMRAFHRRVIAEALPRNEVEILRVRAGEQILGFLYNLIHRGWVGAYCSGFAYGDDAKAKPGYVSYAMAIDRHLALGNRVFDFLAGDSRYKTSLGRPGERLVWFDLQKPRLGLKIERGLRRVRDRLKQQG